MVAQIAEKIINFITCKIVNPCLNIFVEKDFHNIPRGFCNRNQSQKVLQRHHICLADYDCDYTLDKKIRQDKIEYERRINIDDNED